MADPLTIVFIVLSVAMVSVFLALTWRYVALVKIASGQTQDFLVGLIGLMLSFLGVEAFWVGLILFNLLVHPDEAHWQTWRYIFMLLWLATHAAPIYSARHLTKAIKKK